MTDISANGARRGMAILSDTTAAGVFSTQPARSNGERSMIDQIKITLLAHKYATKQQTFDAHRYQNTAGKTAEQQRQQTVAYYVAEAEMLDAYDQLQLALRSHP